MAKKRLFQMEQNKISKGNQEVRKRKKYEIIWELKPEKATELCKKKLPVLKEDKKKEIKTDNKKLVNILIEEDSYRVISKKRIFIDYQTPF